MLDSGLIHKIQKAKVYTSEPQRIHFESMKVAFDGNNGAHSVEFGNGQWRCDCDYFGHHNTCSHTMAMERILGKMVAEA